MKISQFVKESPAGTYRAEIHENKSGYYIDYYGPTGEKLKTENCASTSIKGVSDLAENWINSIQTLNG